MDQQRREPLPELWLDLPTFGAHAGYNYQFGQGVVLGGESDVSPK